MPNQALRLVSIGLFALLALFLLVFGALYASVQNLLWFHAAAVPHEALEAVRPIYFALMKLVGGASIGLALLCLYVVFGPLRRGAPFAAEALVVAIATPVVMAAIVAEGLAAHTGAPTSWHIMGALLALDGIAYLAHFVARTRPSRLKAETFGM